MKTLRSERKGNHGRRKHSLLKEVRPSQFPSALCFFLSCDLRIRNHPGTHLAHKSLNPLTLKSGFTQFAKQNPLSSLGSSLGRVIDTWEQSCCKSAGALPKCQEPWGSHKPSLLALLGPSTLKEESPGHTQ